MSAFLFSYIHTLYYTNIIYLYIILIILIILISLLFIYIVFICLYTYVYTTYIYSSNKRVGDMSEAIYNNTYIHYIYAQSILVYMYTHIPTNVKSTDIKVCKYILTYRICSFSANVSSMFISIVCILVCILVCIMVYYTVFV